MAIAIVGKPSISNDGLHVRVPLDFEVEPDPHGLADWQQGWATGKRLNINGLDLGPPIGVCSVDFNDYALRAKANPNPEPTVENPTPTPLGDVPVGEYLFRFAFVNLTTGVEDYVSDLGGNWGASNYPLVPTAVGNIVFKFYKPVPAGYKARIYLTNSTDPDYSVRDASLRLMKDNIAAGQSSYVMSTLAYDDDTRAPTKKRSWLCYWRIPEANRILYGGLNPGIGAAQGLITDEHGNETASFINVSCTNYSRVGSDGFVSLNYPALSDPTKNRYVSPEYGDNANPGTIEEPWETLDYAFSRAAVKSDWVINVLRGSEFAARTIKLFNDSNSLRHGTDDPNYPLIIQSYWYEYEPGAVDPGTRPVIQFYNTLAALLTANTASNNGGMWKNVIWQEFHLKGLPLIDGTWPAGPYVFRVLCPCRDITWSDCIFENTSFAFDTDLDGICTGMFFNRCNAFDQKVTTQKDRHWIFISGPMGTLFSGNFCDHVGFWINASGDEARRERNHIQYGQNLSIDNLCVGNVMRQACSDAFKIRGGGVIAWNLGLRNSLFCNTIRHSSHFCYNVTTDAEYKSQAFVLSSDAGIFHHSNQCIVEFNIAARAATQINGALEALVNTGLANERRRYAVFRHNLVFDHAHASKTKTGPPFEKVIFEKNILIASNASWSAYRWEIPNDPANPGVPLATDFTWLQSDYNYLYSPGTEKVFLKIGDAIVATTLAQVRDGYGLDTHSVMAPTAPTIANPTYGIGDWSAALGGPDNEEDWRQAIRWRKVREWHDWCDGAKAFPMFAEAFKVTSAPPIDLETEFGFYGPLDPRGITIPLTYTLTGPSVGVIGTASRLVLSPSNVSDDTVAFFSDSSGSFFPTEVTYGDNSNPLETFYTPQATGVHHLSAVRTAGGTPGSVATLSLPVPGGGTGLYPYKFAQWLKRLSG